MYAIVGLKIVTNAKIRPTIEPIIAKLDNSGFDQVNEAPKINSRRENPVLFTTPFIVMAFSLEIESAIDFLKVSDCNAGLAVLIDKCLLIFFCLLYSYPWFFIAFILC